VYYSLGNENNMFKIGFFIFIKRGDVIVRKWSSIEEEFVRLDDEIEKGYIKGVKMMDFDLYLGPYPYERFNI